MIAKQFANKRAGHSHLSEITVTHTGNNFFSSVPFHKIKRKVSRDQWWVVVSGDIVAVCGDVDIVVDMDDVDVNDDMLLLLLLVLVLFLLC